MSSTTQPTNFQDLYTDLLNRIREQTGVTATTVQAKRYINIANQDIYVTGAEKLPWSERRSTITTHAQYTTGTLTATQGSQTITGSSTAWNTSNAFAVANMRAGGKIVISGGDEVYEVTAVASDTSATISPSYVGKTAAGASYYYFEDEYALATDFARPMDQRSFDTARTIVLLGRQDFRRMYPRNRIPTSQIRHAAILDLPFSGSTVPVRKIQFAPPPSDVQVIPYTYVTKYLAVSSAGVAAENLSGDTDEPILPLRYRHVLIFHGLYHWYRDRKDDARSQEAKGEYEQLRARMLGDMEIGGQKARVTTRARMYRANAKAPWRGTSRRFDVNGRFDHMED